MEELEDVVKRVGILPKHESQNLRMVQFFVTKHFAHTHINVVVTSPKLNSLYL